MKGIIFLVTLFTVVLLKAQQPVLTLPLISGGAELDAGKYIWVDQSGNRYVAGNFSGSVDFQGQLLTGQGMEDAFVAKFDSLGNLIWVRTAGGDTSDRGMAVKTDVDGNVYFCGTFHSNTFNIGDTVIYSCGCSDFAFMCKFTGEGDFQWAESFQGDGAVPVKDVICHSNGNIYFTGNFFNATFFGTETITPVGSGDIFIAEFASSGSLTDVKTYGGTGADDLLSSVESQSGNIIITGYFGKKVAFDNDTLESVGGNDIFLVKLNQDLQAVEAASFGGPGDDRGMGVCVLPSGDVAFSGTIFETAFFDGVEVPGFVYYDMFSALADSSLNIKWVRAFGGGFDDFARAVSCDTAGNIYMTGDFMLDVDFTDTLLSANSYSEAFVLKLDNAGNTKWAVSLGGNRHDFGNSLSVSGEDRLLFTGSFNDSLLYQSGYIQGNGSTDIFIGEIKPGENNISENRFDDKFSLYPNPSTGLVFIESGDDIQRVELYSMNGLLLVRKSKVENSMLDLSSYPAGPYYLKIQSEKSTFVRKIILCN